MIEKCNIEDLENAKEIKRKYSRKTRKENTIKSLREVESFLWDLKQVFKGIGVYKILKK